MSFYLYPASNDGNQQRNYPLEVASKMDDLLANETTSRRYSYPAFKTPYSSHPELDALLSKVYNDSGVK